MSDAIAPKAAAGAQPIGIHAGANVVRAKYIADHSHSPTDVIQLMKIPRDAVVDEVILAPLVGEGSSPAIVVLQIGDGGDPNRYMSLSWSATLIQRATTGLGFQYTFSDDAAVQFDTIDATVDEAILSASQGFYLTVIYHIDE